MVNVTIEQDCNQTGAAVHSLMTFAHGGLPSLHDMPTAAGLRGFGLKQASSLPISCQTKVYHPYALNVRSCSALGCRHRRLRWRL